MRLRTSDLTAPGYRRRRHGHGFSYLGLRGERLTDARELQRVRALVIPPAWRDVWISPHPNGHIQAVGTDEAGRRQYLYHPLFREQQEAAKHARVLELGAVLPEVRREVATGLGGPGLSRERVLSLGIRLLDVGFFRVGDERYVRSHDSYGLTTVRRDQITGRRGGVVFTYAAKSGTRYCRAIDDAEACAALRALLRRRGGDERLFAYWESRRWHPVNAGDLNEHLRGLAGLDVTCKDFRTWHATVLAAVALAVSAPVAGASQAARKRACARAVREVAGYLGNTPAVCRSSYINPRLFELFDEGRTIAPSLASLGSASRTGTLATHGPAEAAVLRLLGS
ncbi:DNA topoisomerase IB [Streptomyces candidus]|uniref:DNA topoisomerase n=1 Tax=Streptomyces candidus TaxID=67283 RepID=A0A7X0HD29_9ACTN|nr:DNA topoisomerase IB [Streptomyces candidus]MBB6434329.1 DNA topoisomerase IB [Streptomyces candidus]GHH37064.1 DNA topoisomerase [Streptomyces candidus]